MDSAEIMSGTTAERVRLAIYAPQGESGQVMISTLAGMEAYVSSCARNGNTVTTRGISPGDVQLAECVLEWIAETDGHWWYSPSAGGPFHIEGCVVSG